MIPRHLRLPCFACGRPIRSEDPWYVTTGERVYADQEGYYRVPVGPDCHKKIKYMGYLGYQPEGGGPRLFAFPYKGQRF